MFAARFFVGVGEAAYASVGLAVVLSIFPPQQRSAVTGAFMSGSMVGSVLGIGWARWLPISAGEHPSSEWPVTAWRSPCCTR
jgi:MFS family permease